MGQPELVFYGKNDLDKIPQLQKLSPEIRFGIQAVSSVLPFRVNKYVVDHLIDWDRAPDDPIFQLTFLHEGLLERPDFRMIADAIHSGADSSEIRRIAQVIRSKLNPHPAGQLTHNVPTFQGRPVKGLQHKYNETALIFPAAGQTCYTFCSFCFRWPQFINDGSLKFSTSAGDDAYLSYLESKKSITDVLVTGGDPMLMKTVSMAKTIGVFLEPRFSHIQNIRIGTKVLTYWPHRFTTDTDADELLRLLAKLVDAGKHVSLMAHFNHPREISPETELAIRRLRSVGVVIRTQSPILRHINDDPKVWIEMWNKQVSLGAIPYYMFVERDTGPKHYFELPIARAYDIFTAAYSQVSGLAKTVRGPSMSALPGKVAIQGVVNIGDHKYFLLNFLQARNPEWTNRPFFARYDEKATWLDKLKPAFGEKSFFFDEPIRSSRRLEYASPANHDAIETVGSNEVA